MKEGFEKAGIKVDSSVMQGCKIYANDMELDFTNAPKESIYRFEDDVLQEDSKGRFVEVQICSFQHSIATSLFSIYYNKKHQYLLRHLTDGSHARKNSKPVPAPRMSKWQIIHRRQGFSLGGVPSLILNYELHKSRAPYVVIISHPKDIMPITTHNIRGMNGKGFEFKTFRDIL
jgi:hypothetical protein